MSACMSPYEKLIIILALLFVAQLVHADSLRALLMPGSVTAVHQKFEQDCGLCHETGSKKHQGQLCTNCHSHTNIKNDIIHKTGFHGRLPGAIMDNCKHCHTEHKGRNTKIALFNTSSFDHRKTDFELLGKHAKLSCTSCHKSGKKYAEAPSQCYACHKKDDVHDGKQGKDCSSCHAATGWKNTTFDHNKKTDFPLKGAHQKTSCDSCHINQKYKGTPNTCDGCHKIQDVHKGGYGTDCNSCHTTLKWAQTKFDHNKKTDFPLFGAHRSARCNDCHSSGILKKTLPKNCYGCHKNDDAHKGRFGEKCSQCHTTVHWAKSKFDHSKTHFPLRGNHADLLCADCHKNNLKTKLKTECVACHQKDDVHKGKQGKHCASCHNEKNWKNNVRFDHDLSSFPLIGMHAVTACDECHVSTQYSSAPSACNDCHANDDVHKTKLGTNCQSCHNPNSWKTWLFNHDKASSFKLDGAHKKIGCYDCHNTPSKGKLKASSECISCHRRDDIHNGQFGGDCSQCHNTENFREIHINR
jgi:hypothetical protein